MWVPSDWRQQVGSFIEPVVPPVPGVCDAPLVCVSFNQSWLPYVLGSMMQLVQPSSWVVSTDADLQDVLARATDLIAIVGTAMPCNTNPPNLGGTTSSRACNIAGYLAHAVIRESLQKAIDAIQADQTVLGYGVAIIGLIPGAGLIINGIMKALQGIYNAIFSGTLTHYQDAAADDTLWSRMTCAIYGAISTDGAVTDGNYGAVHTAVCGVTYMHADVITTICNYVGDLGASGLENLQQMGALSAYDCSGCGTGVATGPPALPPLEASGRVDITIATGTSLGQSIVTFDTPFSSDPVILVTCNEQDFICSADGGSTVGFTASIKSAVDLDSSITATVFWIAVQDGWL